MFSAESTELFFFADFCDLMKEITCQFLSVCLPVRLSVYV